MASDLLYVACALAAVVLPLALACFLLGRQGDRGKRRPSGMDTGGGGRRGTRRGW